MEEREGGPRRKEEKEEKKTKKKVQREIVGERRVNDDTVSYVVCSCA
jgi:hypothetical protein